MGLISLLVGGAMDTIKTVKQNNAKNNDEKHHVVVAKKYEIDVPSFLSERHDLSEDASLQYGSNILDIAFQVIDEPKSEFVDSLCEFGNEIPGLNDNETILGKMAVLCLRNYFEDIDKVEIGDYRETKINGLNAITLNAFQKRTFFKDAMYTTLAFIEGKETLYQIMIVSGGTSIQKLADKLSESIHSFKEL